MTLRDIDYSKYVLGSAAVMPQCTTPRDDSETCAINRIISKSKKLFYDANYKNNADSCNDDEETFNKLVNSLLKLKKVSWFVFVSCLIRYLIAFN